MDGKKILKAKSLEIQVGGATVTISEGGEIKVTSPAGIALAASGELKMTASTITATAGTVNIKAVAATLLCPASRWCRIHTPETLARKHPHPCKEVLECMLEFSAM